MTDEDRPMADAHLRAALAHAPDHDAGPPAHLSERIRAEALRATTPRRGWRQWLLSSLDLLQRPAIGAAFASLVLGTAIVLIWRDADVPQAMQPSALEESPAAAMRDRAPPALKPAPAPAADGHAEAPPAQPAPKTAEAAPARPRELRRAAPAAEDSRTAQQHRAPAVRAAAEDSRPPPQATRPGEAAPRIVAAAPAAAAPPSPSPAAPAPQTPAPAETASAEAGPPIEVAPAPAAAADLAAAAPAPQPAALAGGETERRLDKASIAPAGITSSLARNLATASLPLDPLAPLQSTLATIDPAGAWLREVGRLTRGRWQLLPAPGTAAPPLYGPGGALLGHLAVDDDGVLWQPSSLASQAWRAPLPATDTERLRRALAAWRDQPAAGASAPR